jgi:hypothetical protein
VRTCFCGQEREELCPRCLEKSLVVADARRRPETTRRIELDGFRGYDRHESAFEAVRRQWMRRGVLRRIVYDKAEDRHGHRLVLDEDWYLVKGTFDEFFKEVWAAYRESAPRGAALVAA